MKLYEFPQWKIEFRNNAIALLNNDPVLVTQLDSYLISMQSEFDGYKSYSSILTNTKKALINGYAFISAKYINIIEDLNYPPYSYSFSSEGFKSLYSMFTVNLPSTTTLGYFTVTPPSTLTYDNGFHSLISSAKSSDVNNLQNLQEGVIPSTDQILYTMYGPQLKIKSKKNTTVKQELLTTLKFQECINAFGWTLPGF